MDTRGFKHSPYSSMPIRRVNKGLIMKFSDAGIVVFLIHSKSIISRLIAPQRKNIRTHVLKSILKSVKGFLKHI